MKSNELKILNAFGHSLIRCERISGLNSVISRILRILSKIKNKTKKIESKCRLFVATHFIHFENCIRLTGRVIDSDMKKTRDFGLIIIWFFIGKYIKGKKQSIFLFVSLQFGFNFEEYSIWCNWLAHDSAQQWSHKLYFSKYNTSFIVKIWIYKIYIASNK